jgi:hypothetical protein
MVHLLNNLRIIIFLGGAANFFVLGKFGAMGKCGHWEKEVRKLHMQDVYKPSLNIKMHIICSLDVSKLEVKCCNCDICLYVDAMILISTYVTTVTFK